MKTPEEGSATIASEIYNPSTNDITGVSLAYESGDMCDISTGQVKYQVTIQIECGTSERVTPKGQEGNHCQPIFLFEGKQGCPLFSMNAFSRFLIDYYYLWGAALIIFGAFLAFFGNKFINAVIFLIVGFGTFMILGSLFFYMFLSKVNKDAGKWLTIAVISVISLLAGYLVVRMRKWGILIISGWGGVMLGMFVCLTFYVKSPAAYWIIVIIFAGVFAFIGYKVETIAVCFATSFIGAYCLIRGISFYAGGFPAETQLYRMI